MGVWYITREDVKSARDTAYTARDNARLDRAIENASRSAESKLRRRFYPEIRTVGFDWPNHSYAGTGRIWLDANEMISLTTFTSGGVTIPPAGYLLRRADDRDEPPYTYVEINRASNYSLSAGNTSQRSALLTGLYGYQDTTASAGTVTEALDAVETEVQVSDSSRIGTGTLLKVDSERMIVTERAMLTTGQTVQTSALTADDSNTTVLVTSGAALNAGEVILIDAEKMYVTDVAGNSLIVKRAWDGSALAAHSTGATIYAPRSLTVERGVLGTTATTHDISAPLRRQTYPGPVAVLTMAYALDEIAQEDSGFARTTGSAENERETYGKGIARAETNAKRSCGRNMRSGAV